MVCLTTEEAEPIFPGPTETRGMNAKGRPRVTHLSARKSHHPGPSYRQACCAAGGQAHAILVIMFPDILPVFSYDLGRSSWSKHRPLRDIPHGDFASGLTSHHYKKVEGNASAS